MWSGVAGTSGEAGSGEEEGAETFCGTEEGGEALGETGSSGGRGIVAGAGPASRSTVMGRSGEGKRQVSPENLIQSKSNPWIRRETTTAATQGER